MKTRILLFLALFGMAAGNAGRPPGIYLVSELDLVVWADRAAGWKDFFTIAGDKGFAAYYAGRESVYREQLAAILDAVPAN